MLLIDTCGVELTPPLARALIDEPREDQITVLAAAGAGQLAFEVPRLQGGLFTYAVLDALKVASQSQRMDFTLSDLGRHVIEKVEKLSAELGVRQLPDFRTDDGQFTLVRRMN